MGTFVDSIDLLEDPPALRARMRQDVYLFFRGLLDRAEVLGVAREALSRVATLGWVRPDVHLDAVEPAVPAPAEGEPYTAGVSLVQRLESLHRLANTPRLLPVTRALTGSDAFRHPAHVIRFVWPYPPELRDGGKGDWIHQDWSIMHVPDMFTMWYPLLDTAREDGPLRILAGGHRDGQLGRIWLDEPVGVATDDERWVSTDYRAGDVVVFHCLTPHTAMVNRSARIRMSAEVRFQSPRHGVPSIALLPAVVQHWRVTAPELSDIPLAWAELTDGWTSHEWYRYPADVDVFSHVDPKLHDQRHPASAYL